MNRILKRKKAGRFRLKNAAQVWRGDARRIYNSIVGTIILFGLSVVPCLYAWFNIFSNWDPYGVDATSRIRVAVTSDDRGADLMGMVLNVGDMVIEGLEANDSIGWVFVDTEEEALRLVDSGDCYAALAIPQDFSHDVVSFIALDFQHPTIRYYENAKKNAIAPKITGKAKTAVQEQVNATFAETIASLVSNVLSVADANGMDFEGTLRSISTKADNLGARLDDVDALLASVCRLLQSTQSLMYNSGVLSGNVSDTSYAAGHYSSMLGNRTDDLHASVNDMNKAVMERMEETEQRLREIEERINQTQIAQQELSEAVSGQTALLEELSTEIAGTSEPLSQAEEQPTEETQLPVESAAEPESVGQTATEEIAPTVEPSPAEPTPEEPQTQEQTEPTESPEEEELPPPSELLEYLRTEMDALSVQVGNVMSNMSAMTLSAADAFYNIGGKTAGLSDTLLSSVSALEQTREDLYEAREALSNAQSVLRQLSDSMRTLSESEFLIDLTGTVMDKRDELAPYFASPIRMNTVVMYPIENYGSAMAPFYTVLAQWVGALFCAALLKARVRREDMPCKLSLAEEFIGRFGLFFTVGMIQALVCALGDLWFVGIYCLHPGLFVLAALVTGLCFSLINYALLFSLEKIGLGASVILMLVQVAGSGGSYPVEVVPEIFRRLYPFMPFNYAMNAMREAIAGTYGNHYPRDILILLLISALFFALGLVLYHPAHRLNQMVAESAEKSEIML